MYDNKYKNQCEYFSPDLSDKTDNIFEWAFFLVLARKVYEADVEIDVNV